MGLCRDEKEDLLSRLDGARPASLSSSRAAPAAAGRVRGGPRAPAAAAGRRGAGRVGLVRCLPLQCELRELEELEATVRGEEPVHVLADDAANPAAGSSRSIPLLRCSGPAAGAFRLISL